MRLSTSSMYAMGLSAMLKQQSNLTDVSQQLASGKRIVSPSDDPRAAAQALVVSQSLAVNEQYAASRTTAQQNLEMEDGVLQNVTTAIQGFSQLVVQAGNGTLSAADRESIAAQADGIYQEMLGLANSQDGNGNYIFSGLSGSVAPFEADATGNVSYKGSATAMEQKVDTSRMMATGDTGADVFTSVSNGARFVARADSDNTGTVTFKGPDIADPNNANYGSDFTITFAKSGSTTTYIAQTVDSSGNVTTIDSGDYIPGQTLSIAGLSLTLDGEPTIDAANGTSDSITVSRGSTADSNILNTMAEFVSALRQPIESDSDQARYSNALASTSRQVSNSLDNVLTVQASIGSKLNELDALNVTGDSRSVNYKSTLSDLQDLDYASAISDYTLKQVGLQASMKTFTQIQGMSLFDLL